MTHGIPRLTLFAIFAYQVPITIKMSLGITQHNPFTHPFTAPVPRPVRSNIVRIASATLDTRRPATMSSEKEPEEVTGAELESPADPVKEEKPQREWEKIVPIEDLSSGVLQEDAGTPLLQAARDHDIDRVKMLVTLGEDINAEHKTGDLVRRPWLAFARYLSQFICFWWQLFRLAWKQYSVGYTRALSLPVY